MIDHWGLPWLQTSRGDSDYEKLIFALEVSCTLSQNYALQLTTLRTFVREPLQLLASETFSLLSLFWGSCWCSHGFTILSAFLSRVCPPIYTAVHATMLSKKHRGSSTVQVEGQTNEGRHHLLLFHKAVVSKFIVSQARPHQI